MNVFLLQEIWPLSSKHAGFFLAFEIPINIKLSKFDQRMPWSKTDTLPLTVILCSPEPGCVNKSTCIDTSPTASVTAYFSVIITLGINKTQNKINNIKYFTDFTSNSFWAPSTNSHNIFFAKSVKCNDCNKNNSRSNKSTSPLHDNRACIGHYQTPAKHLIGRCIVTTTYPAVFVY